MTQPSKLTTLPQHRYLNPPQGPPTALPSYALRVSAARPLVKKPAEAAQV